MRLIHELTRGIEVRVSFILDMERSLIGSGVYTSATRIAKKLESSGIKVDINGKNHPYDIYHFHTSLPQSFIKAQILSKQKKRKYKIIMTGHTTIEDFRNSFLFSNHIDFALTPYLKKFYSFSDYLIAVSEYNRDILLQYGYNYSKINIISNGIELSKNRINNSLRTVTRKYLNFPDDKLLIITVGLCIYRKAPDIFVEVALNSPHHNFLWIGKYLPLSIVAHASLLRKKFNIARKTENIKFTGYVSQKTIEALWNAADVFLYVSREENQGIALLESIAYGKIPVVRDHPVFNWLTSDKDCLKGKTVEDFCLQIDRLSHNNKLIRRLQSNGKNTLEKHDINNSIKELADLYTYLT